MSLPLHDLIAGADEAHVITAIREGADPKSSMPAFGRTLAPDQVADILACLKKSK